MGVRAVLRRPRLALGRHQRPSVATLGGTSGATDDAGMLNAQLNGFHVLIVSDHAELASLFAAIVAACGATAVTVTTVVEALQALRRRPHAVLLDVATEDERWAVSLEARRLKVPLVALTQRIPDPRDVPVPVRQLAARLLNSTELEVVCKTLHEAASDAA